MDAKWWQKLTLTHPGELKTSRKCLDQSQTMVSMLDFKLLWKVKTLLQDPWRNIYDKSDDFTYSSSGEEGENVSPIRGQVDDVGFRIAPKRYLTSSVQLEEYMWYVWRMGMQWFWKSRKCKTFTTKGRRISDVKAQYISIHSMYGLDYNYKIYTIKKAINRKDNIMGLLCLFSTM